MDEIRRSASALPRGAGTTVIGDGSKSSENHTTRWDLQPDLGEAQRFLTLLDENAEQFTFQTFDDNRDRKDSELSCILHGRLWECAAELTRLNRQGAGIFVMAQAGDLCGRTNGNVIRIRAVFQEDDGEGKPMPLEPHIVNETSPGKYHRYLLCEGLSIEEFRAAQGRLVGDYGSDKNAKDPARVLRLPGFYHRKVDSRKGLSGEPFMVRIIYESGGQPYPREEILKALPPIEHKGNGHRAEDTGTAQIDNRTYRDLRSALASIRSDDRNLWVRMGHALKELGDVGRGLWLEWSQTSAKYEPQDAARVWDSFKPEHTGYAAVFAEAQHQGWVNPAYSKAGGAGGPFPVEDARAIVAALNGADPGAWFEDRTLDALATLKSESYPEFERAIAEARRAKVSLKELKAAVTKCVSVRKNSTRGDETHETHFNLAETPTIQGFKADLQTPPQTHSARRNTRIVRPGGLPESVDAAERILVREEADFYQRGGQLVRTCVKRAETVRGIMRPDGAVTILPMDAEYLLDKLNRLIQWKREKSMGDSVIEVECDAPRKVAATLLARRGHWLARPLTGVINAPTLRPDGSILYSPGYDAATGLLFVDGSGAESLPVPERPSQADAQAALEILKDVIKDFPFAEGHDRSTTLSAILTAVIRHSLRAAPMHTFSAPKMASGKSLLADVISFIATGAPATVMSYTEDADEMRKRIISTLVQGDLIINIDNIEAPLASQTLCTVLTQEEFTDRLLGTNKTVTAPTNCCWFATGNNLLIKGDLITRVIPCELDPKCESPEAREFDRNLYEWIPQNRARLIQAALTVLRAYHVAGRPKQAFKNFARFEEWSGWVRGALVWLGEPDPCLGREKLVEADPVSQLLKNLLIAWHDTYKAEPTTTKQAISDANKTLTAMDGAISYQNESLHDALLEICGGRDGKLNGRRLGNYLERYERRVEAGARFERRGSKNRYICWRVILVDESRFNRAKNEFGDDFENQPETRIGQGFEPNSNEFHEFHYPGRNFSSANARDIAVEEGDA